MVTACYVLLNLVYLAVLPIDVVRTSTRVAAEAADAVVGRGGSAFMAGLVMMSSLGALTDRTGRSTRITRWRTMDSPFGGLAVHHPVHRTPSRAIGARHLVVRARGDRRTARCSPASSIPNGSFFALMAAGLSCSGAVLDTDPPYRTWGYPVVPVVFILASLAIVANQVYRQPVEAAVGLGLVAAGLPLYYLSHARR